MIYMVSVSGVISGEVYTLTSTHWADITLSSGLREGQTLMKIAISAIGQPAILSLRIIT